MKQNNYYHHQSRSTPSTHLLANDGAHSDSEATRSYAPLSSRNSRTALSRQSVGGSNGSNNINIDHNRMDGNQTDEDIELGDTYMLDEFGDSINIASKLLRTGRQRKKLAARSKGGEFQSRRKKRRVYFCCVSSEIDVQKLYDYLVGAGGLLHGWKYQLHGEVLHLYKNGSNTDATTTSIRPSNASSYPLESPKASSVDGTGGSINAYSEIIIGSSVQYESNNFDGDYVSPRGADPDSNNGNISNGNHDKGNNKTSRYDYDSKIDLLPVDVLSTKSSGLKSSEYDRWVDPLNVSSPGTQEVFIFDFGTAVFWNFSRGEETNLLKTIRMFVIKGLVAAAEFKSGQDDMAFVTSPETDVISISNDVITLPEDTQVKQRLSVSFAISQSTVLAIFEARIERKVEEYKYIPEALAACGKVHLTGRQLGIMIGEVFVIRHDVNLHSEILDTPDFFWSQSEKCLTDYRLVMSYLEMSARTEVLNKRLDMLRELLDVLQQQMESSHSSKLEWIVIWLIIMEVILQVFAIGSENFKWFS